MCFCFASSFFIDVLQNHSSKSWFFSFVSTIISPFVLHYKLFGVDILFYWMFVHFSLRFFLFILDLIVLLVVWTLFTNTIYSALYFLFLHSLALLSEIRIPDFDKHLKYVTKFQCSCFSIFKKRFTGQNATQMSCVLVCWKSTKK